jgi:hypothetical protein
VTGFQEQHVIICISIEIVISISIDQFLELLDFRIGNRKERKN